MNPLQRSSDPQAKSLILQRAIAIIEKAYGKGSIFQLGSNEVVPVNVISTGSPLLDQAIIAGGIPRGGFTEIYGVESSGKTTLALTVIRNCQRAGGTAAIVDVEHALDLAYAAKLGVDIANLLVSQPESGEQAMDIVETLVRAGVDVVVLDSVAMLVPEAEIAGEMDEVQMGAQARLMGKAIRKLKGPVRENDTALIMINQIRSNMSKNGGNPEVTPGGRALRYQALLRLDLRKVGNIEDGEQIVGITIRAKVIKNKVAKHGNQADFDIYANKGISFESSLVKAALLAGIITRSGAWLSLGEMKFQGMARLIEWLEENPEESAKLKELL